MKIIYLTYGNQSGVVTKLCTELKKRGIMLKIINVAEGLNYRYEKIKLPKLTLTNIINSYRAIIKFKRNWKEGYIRTDYAYDKMSRIAENEIRKSSAFDIVLQSGLLFAPEVLNKRPYVLGILDNTYLIGKNGKNRPVTSLNLSQYFLNKETEAYKRADLIFAMSNHVRDSLVIDYNIDPEKVIVTGVGPNIYPEDNAIVDDNKYNSKKIVMIGMNFVNKGGMEVMEAFKRLTIKIPGVRLVVIGDNPRLKVEGATFLGIQGKERIRQELSTANLYVMPSHAEAFGVAFLEAMAFYTPCIGTEIEAIPEIIDDSKTGYIVKPYDIQMLTDRMEQILINPDLARKMGKEGNKKYKNKYEWAKISKAIELHLSKLCKC